MSGITFIFLLDPQTVLGGRQERCCYSYFTGDTIVSILQVIGLRLREVKSQR